MWFPHTKFHQEGHLQWFEKQKYRDKEGPFPSSNTVKSILEWTERTIVRVLWAVGLEMPDFFVSDESWCVWKRAWNKDNRLMPTISCIQGDTTKWPAKSTFAEAPKEGKKIMIVCIFNIKQYIHWISNLCLFAEDHLVELH